MGNVKCTKWPTQYLFTYVIGITLPLKMSLKSLHDELTSTKWNKVQKQFLDPVIVYITKKMFPYFIIIVILFFIKSFLSLLKHLHLLLVKLIIFFKVFC